MGLRAFNELIFEGSLRNTRTSRGKGCGGITKSPPRRAGCRLGKALADAAIMLATA